MRLPFAVVALLLVLAAPARAQDRLDRAAEELRSSSLYVHPELDGMLSDQDRRIVLDSLRDAYLTFNTKVVVMPLTEADESGGEAERMLWALDDRLSKVKRLLIAVDQRGNFTLVQARMEHGMDVPFEIEYGPSGEDEPRQTVVPRLRAVFQIASEGEPDSYFYQRDRPDEPLDPLPEDRSPRELRDDDSGDSPRWLVLVGAGIGGLITGLVGWGIALPFRKLRRG